MSSRERSLLADWERTRTQSVTVRDIAREVGERAAYAVAATLVRKGVLDRIRPGLYAVRPFRAMARPWNPSALVAVELLLAGEPHYVGGLAAFTLNRLTLQQHTSVVDAFTTSFRRPRRLGGADIIFHRRKPTVFGVGLTHLDVGGVEVAVSDPEHTMLDALEEFRVVGGMSEAIHLFREALPRIDRARLANYALEIARDSTCQRLGLLLDRAGADGPFMDALRRRAAESTGQHLLIPGMRRVGPISGTWRVVENDRALEAGEAAPWT